TPVARRASSAAPGCPVPGPDSPAPREAGLREPVRPGRDGPGGDATVVPTTEPPIVRFLAPEWNRLHHVVLSFGATRLERARGVLDPPMDRLAVIADGRPAGWAAGSVPSSGVRSQSLRGRKARRESARALARIRESVAHDSTFPARPAGPDA